MNRLSKLLNKKKTTLFILSVGVIVTLSIMALSKTEKENLPDHVMDGHLTLEAVINAQTPVLDKIHEIQIGLDSLNKNSGSRAHEMSSDVQEFEKHLQHVEDSMGNTMTKDDIQIIQSHLEELKNLIQKQLKPANNRKVHETIFINPKDVGFKLRSIDVWNGRKYAQLQYNGQEQLFSEGDSLFDWKLISTDFEKGRAEFINEQDRHLILHLEGA